MKLINTICLGISILAIVMGITISILAIWNVVETSDFFWRSLMTMGVLFLGSILTVTVNNFFPQNSKSHDDK